MEINDLTVLHFNEGKSDKVWGHFYTCGIDADRIHYKFWGKRKAKWFQTQIQTRTQLIESENLKLKKGYRIATGRCWDQAKGTLEIQFGITKFKSVVTKEEQSVADGIKPSQVHKTVQVWDDGIKGEIICFYDKKGSSLGKRPVSQRNQIFDHLKKTKEPEFIIEPPKGELETIIWNKMKSPPKTK